MTTVYKLGKRVLSFLIVIAFVLLFCFPAFANNETADGQDPLAFGRLQDGQYTLNVQLNGQGPFVFMVDTGASRTSIYKGALQKLGVVQHESIQRNVSGMVQSEIRPTALINSLNFVGQTFKNHNVIVLDKWDDQEEVLDGILGMDVLSGIVLAFDHMSKEAEEGQKAGVIRVLKERSLRARKYRKWTKIKLTANPYPNAEFGLLFTDTFFGKLRVPTLFDTGSSFTAISWDIVDGTPALAREKKRLREAWTIQGAVGKFNPRTAIEFDGLLVGGVELKKHKLIVMNFDKLPINNYGKYPLVIAGIGFIGEHDFVLDLKTGQLILDVRPKRKRSRNMNNTLDLLPPTRLPL